MYLPNTKFGVVNDIISHGKLSLILWSVHRLNLLNYTSLGLKNFAMLLWNIRQNCYHKWVQGLCLSQTLSQTRHSLHIVPIPCQEGHISPVWHGLNWYCISRHLVNRLEGPKWKKKLLRD